MGNSYLIIISLVFLLSILIDFSLAKVSSRYLSKLLIAISFLYVIFLLRIYMGVKMNLWGYGSGILGIYFYSVPLEEYLFMAVAPYSTIVLWEAFHKIIRRK